jgi:hypothetical protein
MCKPSCCPSKNSHGFSALVAALLLVWVAAIAWPVIKAAEAVLRIVAEVAVITACAIAGIVVVSAAVVITRRVRRMASTPATVSIREQSVRHRPATATVVSINRRAGSIGQDDRQVQRAHAQRVIRHLQSCPACQSTGIDQPHLTGQIGGVSDAW